MNRSAGQAMRPTRRKATYLAILAALVPALVFAGRISASGGLSPAAAPRESGHAPTPTASGTGQFMWLDT